MADVVQNVGAALALLGALLCIAGAVGVLRFPDVYTRIHAASITDTGAAILMILGMILIAGLSLTSLKLMVVWGCLMLTTPTAAHALASAAYGSGVWPWLGPFKITRSGDHPDEGGSS